MTRLYWAMSTLQRPHSELTRRERHARLAVVDAHPATHAEEAAARVEADRDRAICFPAVLEVELELEGSAGGVNGRPISSLTPNPSTVSTAGEM